MRHVQLLLLSAIAVALCVIAFQLTRLAADFQLASDIRAELATPTGAKPVSGETREQRIDRRAREVNKIDEDMKAGFAENAAVEARRKQLRADEARRSR